MGVVLSTNSIGIGIGIVMASLGKGEGGGYICAGMDD